ncbi:cellulose synthase regulator BcsB [Lonsdalea britannica]|uniref:Cyclic di-GMP-binding protein n=1 Tax=Lonsdalea britannica TaxID=1082704 RepID=A0AAD0SIB8_9GAMM|nr:cellulose biosynthesis cyclic di-GMP-binding regulatory protein BcsB [Lonsdalea britannica]AXW88437.1 cellulose synthase regulator BcsB [Lonsdalea britannica]
MTRRLRWFTFILFGFSPITHADVLSEHTATADTVAAIDNAAPPSAPEPAETTPPVRDSLLPFSRLAPPPGGFQLQGMRPDGQIEFGVRSDELVTRAVLQLNYRPSPALLPSQSHLQVFLNDALVGVVPITTEQLGKNNQIQLDLDPRFISDFNRVRLSLVGHYANQCENITNTAIWMAIGQDSTLKLTLQKLPLKNDLSHFPEPFFDSRDAQPLQLPVVFSARPSTTEQRAAAVLASWFGVKADWRGQRFPVLYNQLPSHQHAVVFATNAHRPDFLKAYPLVDKPTVEILSQPDDPYHKMLLILGRDDTDLITAVQGIAQGDVLLRGQSSTIDNVRQLAPRLPYDAPNWAHTDRPTRFSELQQYEAQYQSDGLQPSPISMLLRLPPDLYLVRERSIDMNVMYRYTSPRQNDGSRLAVNLNNQFVQDVPLTTKNSSGQWLLHVPLIQGQQDTKSAVTLPALRLGAANQLRFDFDYAARQIGSIHDEQCETVMPVANHVVIDGDSTVDFSGYRHYLEMPSLRAFANAGFPFSRHADLSQTLLLVNAHPQPGQISTLLNVMGNIGAQTGFPALNVRIADDWEQAETQDVDLLMIGGLPDNLREGHDVNLLVDTTKSWVKKPLRQMALDTPVTAADRKAESQTTILSEGPMAAIVSFQSPYHDQRSVVALLADTPRAYELLNDAMNDTGKRAAIFGAVSIIRESGVNSLRVGDTWFVGYLPWWESIWSAMSSHPVWLASLAVFMVILLALMTWRLMRHISQRRLDDEDASL